GGDLRAALSRIKAKTFVMPMSSDMFFPPSDCQAEWRLIPDAEFRPIQTIDGHLALFGADPGVLSQLDARLTELLAAKLCLSAGDPSGHRKAAQTRATASCAEFGWTSTVWAIWLPPIDPGRRSRWM